MTTAYELNAIRPHALGKFKDLLMATAQSPAMLFYLDNHLSASPDSTMPVEEIERRMAQRRRAGQMGSDPMTTEEIRRRLAQQRRRRKPGINENYARELMELHTMGVDGGYTQKDVQEVARCFTGWTIDQPRGVGGFIFHAWMHDDGEKSVLGHRIPEGGGIKDGEMVIDILAKHPNTARFISQKLVRRFVSDDPPPSLVDRVASVYTETDGDIGEMLRTILVSAEFYSPEAYRAKTKSAFELAVFAIRALGGETDGSRDLAQHIARMGQPLYMYQPPTGYPDRAEQWISSGLLVERWNFGLMLTADRIPGTSVNLDGFTKEGRPDEQAIEGAISFLLGKDISPETRTTLERELSESEAHPNIAKAFAIVLGSPEFQLR